MNEQGANFLENLPLIFFGAACFIDFCILIFGAIKIIFAKNDPQKIQKGKSILWLGARIFGAIFFAFLISFAVSLMLRRGEALKPQTSASADFPPPAHLGTLPPPPNYIRLANTDFIGPYLLKNNMSLQRYAISAVFCKTNNNYDLLYAGQTGKENLAENKNYKCWLSKCKNQENLYLAVFWTPANKYALSETSAIISDIKSTLKPPCGEE